MSTRTLVLAGLVLGVLLAPGRAQGQPVRQNILERAVESLRQAEREFKAGDVARSRRTAARALALIDRAEESAPGGAETALLGVQAAVFAHDLDAARGWFQRYASRSAYGDRDPNLYYCQALIDVRLTGRPERAIRALERMLALAPDARHAARDVLYIEALMMQASRLAKAEEYIEAIKLYRTAELVARRTGRGHLEITARANVAITMARADRLIEAMEIFTALRDGDPQNPLWHWHVGLTFANQSKFAEAAESYLQVTRLLEETTVSDTVRAELVLVHLRLGNCYRNLAGGETNPRRREKLLQDARVTMERYLDLAPRSAMGHYWLGELLLDEFELPYEALAHFEKAFEIDPICDGSLRRLLTIATRYAPPEGIAPDAWDAQREAWQKDLDENAEARRRAREAREKTSADGTNGCA
ncbi:MAG: hypothetical protein ACYTG6_13020 [Planctomycetota bacterium]|jgi:tetratricopeptide (TPR) repeat protein